MKVLTSLLLCCALSLQFSCVSESKESMHVFLLIGQSNMAGRAKLQKGDDKVIPNCQLWNGKQWEAAKPGFNRYATHIKPGFVQGMNCGPEFVKAYQKANPNVKVGIVNWARGGSSIEEWHPDKKRDLYNDAVKHTHAALNAGGGKLMGILWHQGESNSGRSESYPKLLKEHIERLRKEFKQPSLPFVFGQVGQWKDNYAAFNKMIVKQPALIPNTACVLSDNLKNFDSAHFDHKSQLEFGRRYAAEMLKLLKK